MGLSVYRMTDEGLEYKNAFYVFMFLDWNDGNAGSWGLFRPNAIFVKYALVRVMEIVFHIVLVATWTSQNTIRLHHKGSTLDCSFLR